MTPIKVVIVDDEPAAAEVIQELVTQLTTDLQVYAVAANGQEAIQQILQHRPDLVFMDVNLPLINGIQVVEKLPVKDTAVIFTTGSEAFALPALKLEAVDYLLKPIDPAEFLLAVEKARAKLAGRGAVKQPVPGALRIALPTADEISYIDEADILHITGSGSYSQIFLTSGEKLMVSKSIGQLEEKLSPQFFRCHNSHLIHLAYVTSFLKKDGFYVQLKNGTTVEVSRRSKDALLKRLAAFSR